MFSSVKKLFIFPESAHVHSLQAAIYDALYVCMMQGLGEAFLGTFGIYLGGSSLQIGLLATTPPLIGALSQLFGVYLYRKNIPRKKIIVTTAAMQGIVWFFLAILALFFHDSPSAISILIGLSILHYATGNTGGPAWNSLIGDIVPSEIRGKYFGFRNQRSGWITVISMLMAGSVLSAFRFKHAEFFGFMGLFLIACFARLSSATWLNKYHEPGYTIQKESHFTLWDFIRRMPRSNFAKFVFFFAGMNGAAAISTPYFALYMLRDLHLSYMQFSVVTAVQLLTQYIFMQNWGKISDEFGNRRILAVCSIAISLSSGIWLVSSHFWWLVMIQIYSGIFWAGFNLSAANFLFDAVTPQKRAQCAAYMSLINAVFVCIGAGIGGLLITHLPDGFLISRGFDTPPSVYFKVFALSSIIRLSIVFGLLKRFREVRNVEPIRTRELIFRISNIRPISGATFSFITTELRRRKESKNI